MNLPHLSFAGRSTLSVFAFAQFLATQTAGAREPRVEDQVDTTLIDEVLGDFEVRLHRACRIRGLAETFRTAA
jgi:hypothetical protein